VIDWEEFPTLTSPRLRLRRIEDSDRTALFDVFSDPQVMRYWSSPPHNDLAQVDRLIGRIHEGFARRDLLQWGVERIEDGQILGTCTLMGIDPGNRRAEIGYILGRAYWGCGYMNEALVAVVDFAFGPLRLHRLEADADSRNAASCRALERLGFQREGLLRERWIVNDEISDTAFYGLLEREWVASSGSRRIS